MQGSTSLHLAFLLKLFFSDHLPYFLIFLIMDKDTLISALSAITKSWYLDIEFLLNIAEEHHLDLADIIENVEMNFWKEPVSYINYLIYEALSQIAYKFIENNPKLFETESDEFEIFTNYMDSHIWFNSEKVQTEFERFY